MHCYSGSVEMAREFNKIGFLIGIGGIVTFKNAVKLIEVIKSIDLKYIVVETDSPYLSPEPYRGKKNEPKNVKIIMEKICATIIRHVLIPSQIFESPCLFSG